MTESMSVRELVSHFTQDWNCHYWHQLEAMPDLPVDEVVSLLKNDPDEQVRAGAVLAVRWLGLDSGLELLAGAVRSDPSALVREYAADGLGRVGADSAYPVALEALRDPEPTVRSAALKSLSYVAEFDDMPGILKAALEDSEESVRKAAIDAFGTHYHDDRYTDILLRVLHDDDAGVRAVTAKWLGASAKTHSDAAADAAINHSDEMVRAQFVGSIGNISDIFGIHPRSEEFITHALGDPSAKVRAAAADAFGRLKSPTSLDPLRRAIDDVDPEVRHQAMKSLMYMNDAESLDRIATELKNPRASVRYALVYALMRMENKRAIEPLRELLTDASWTVRLEAGKALAVFGDQDVADILIPLYRNPSPRVRREVIYALSHLQGDRVNDVLIDALSDPDDSVALAAAPAFRKRQEPRAVEPLGALLHRVEGGRKFTVCFSLSKQEDPKAAQVLLDSFGDQSNVRYAGFSLVLMKNQAVVEPLVKALINPNRRVRREAAHALTLADDYGLVGEPWVADALIAALCDEDAQTRASATAALAWFKEPRVVDAVMPLLDDSDAYGQAMYTLGELKAEAAVEPLIAIMERDDSARKRSMAVEALGNIGNQQARDALYDFALRHSDGNDWLQEDVVEALRNAGDPRVDDF